MSAVKFASSDKLSGSEFASKHLTRTSGVIAMADGIPKSAFDSRRTGLGDRPVPASPFEVFLGRDVDTPDGLKTMRYGGISEEAS
jgi:hypothetical protein